MSERKTDFEYDVALSFAGEDRTFVEEVYNGLQAIGLKVFYDRQEEATLWGVEFWIFCIWDISMKHCLDTKLWKDCRKS